MAIDPERLRILFGRPGLQRLLERVRDRRDYGRPLTGKVIFESVLPEERRAVDQLLRRPTTTGTTLSVPLDIVLHQLRSANLAGTWEEVVDVLCGPPDPGRRESATKSAAWRELWVEILEAVGRHRPALQDWVEEMRRAGTLKRLSGDEPTLASKWVHQALSLLEQLPFSDEPLATVSTRLTGNSHALDSDTPLSTIVFRGIAILQDCVMPNSAAKRRQLWAKVGVICDELSAPVLTFNLRIANASPLTEITQAAYEGVVPVHLSTRLLLATDWTSVIVPRYAFACENSSIVASACQQLGPSCAPLICLDGEPKTAGWLLLKRLREAGAEVFYHGDFDWEGVAIALRVFSRSGAKPWRYLENDYRAADGIEPLVGSAKVTSWCPGLAKAMIERRILVHEEAVVDTLISDLKI